MDRVHCRRFDESLRAAGIPIHGCSSTGRIDFTDAATAADRKRAAEIIATHDYEACLRADVQDRANAVLDALCASKATKLQRRAALMRAGVIGARITDVDATIAALDDEITRALGGAP